MYRLEDNIVKKAITFKLPTNSRMAFWQKLTILKIYVEIQETKISQNNPEKEQNQRT